MYKVVLFVAAIAGADAAVVGFVASSEKGDVFDDVRLASICVFGSLIGAFLAIAVFPPTGDTEENRTRRLSLKFGASMLSGIAFAPGAMQWIGYPRTTDYLLAGSAATAVFAVSVLHLLAPRVEAMIEKILDSESKKG